MTKQPPQQTREQLKRELRDWQAISRELRERIKRLERAMQLERERGREEAERAWRERNGRQ